MLALDYGSARTGVAVSDATGTLARPLGVVERAATPAGLRRLAELVAAEGAERVVVGLPLTLRGEAGAQAEETAAFVASLEALLDVPVESFDERFTTALAAVRPVVARARGRARRRAPARELAGVDDRTANVEPVMPPRPGRPPRRVRRARSRAAVARVAALLLLGFLGLAAWLGVSAFGDSEHGGAAARDHRRGAEAGDPARRLPGGLHPQGDGRSGSPRCGRSRRRSGR